MLELTKVVDKFGLALVTRNAVLNQTRMTAKGRKWKRKGSEMKVQDVTSIKKKLPSKSEAQREIPNAANEVE